MLIFGGPFLVAGMLVARWSRRVARELQVNEQTLRNWVNDYRKAHAADEPPLTVSERARLRQLEKEVRELRLEKEFLGKAAAFFASEYR
jgi:transposase